MRLRVGIGVARGIERLIAQPLERVVQPLGGLPGRGEEFHGGAVGLFLLAALIGEERPADRFLRREDGGGTGVAHRVGAGAGNHRADPEQHGDDRGGLRGRELFAQPREMAAGDVAGFVREDANDLVRRPQFHDRAGVHEDAPAVHHERVEAAIVDDGDLDVLLREPGAAQDRLGVVPQQLLGFGVANGRDVALRAGRKAGCDQGGRGDHGQRPHGWFCALCFVRCRLIGHDMSFDFAQPSDAAGAGQRTFNHVFLHAICANEQPSECGGRGANGRC